MAEHPIATMPQVDSPPPVPRTSKRATFGADAAPAAEATATAATSNATTKTKTKRKSALETMFGCGLDAMCLGGDGELSIVGGGDAPSRRSSGSRAGSSSSGPKTRGIPSPPLWNSHQLVSM